MTSTLPSPSTSACAARRSTKIQDSARPSLSWWEHFGRSHDTLPGWQFAYHFFTRSLTDGKLRRRDPDFVESAHARWKAALRSRPARQRADDARSHRARPRGHARAPRGPPGRGPAAAVHGADRAGPADGGGWALEITAPEAEADLVPALEAVASGAGAGAALVAVRAGTPLTRRLICEEARLGHGTVALLIEDCDDDTATTAVLSGRADLVAAPGVAAPEGAGA